MHFWVGGLVHLVDDFVRGGNLADFYVKFDALWPTFVILVHGLLEKHTSLPLLFDDFHVLARTGRTEAVTTMGKFANPLF